MTNKKPQVPLDPAHQSQAIAMADALVDACNERVQAQLDLELTWGESSSEAEPNFTSLEVALGDDPHDESTKPSVPKAKSVAKPKSQPKAKRKDDDESEEAEEAEEEEDDDDLADELEEELKSSLEEAAEDELAALLEETGGSTRQTLSSLRAKLKLLPNGDFPVSPYANYSDTSWTLFYNQYGSARKIIFESLTPPLQELKKAISYHMIPEFAPFGTIRSYVTTHSQSSLFAILDRYLLKPNHLDGSPASITLINHHMVNRALNEAKLSDTSSRHYHSLFYMIRLWVNLSLQDMMPEGLELRVQVPKIDTVERRKDVIQQYSGSMSTWKPFGQEDLGKLIDYALFWTEKASTRLLDVVSFVKENGLDTTTKCAVVRYQSDDVIESNLNITLDGVELVNASKKSYDYEYGTREQHVYSWLFSYSKSVDQVRNAIYILVALITGLRSGELNSLTFDDLIKDGNGVYTLQATRFKTADDPNSGEVVYLPIPQFIGQKIEELQTLRSIYTLKAQNFIFQPCTGRKALSKPNNQIIQAICRKIEAATGVDRVHSHRFRKTIAEILINRSERNIDLIRHLFGHHSYAMTLKYISKNPFLVRSVAVAIEQNYTIEFSEIVKAVQSGASSGPTADRLLERIRAKPNAFSGKQLKVTVFAYVSHLLSSGEPLFIHRTAMGTFCVSTKTYSSPNLPPCLAHLKGTVTGALPDHTRCDNSCEHIVVVESAKSAIQDNLKFYSNMLEQAADTLSERAKKMIRQKIASNTQHLTRLNDNEAPTIPVKVIA